ncbi:MAG: PAS domain-containing protein [Sulfitobacter sp.]|nr:PAS domain-containing protein [Sulfitobacter sp.]
MLNTLSIAQLDELLDQFSVPMFAIERRGPDHDFRITCMNRALEELAGQMRQDLLGKPVLELAAAAEEMLEFYQRCVTTRQTIRFAFFLPRNSAKSGGTKPCNMPAAPKATTALSPPQSRFPKKRRFCRTGWRSKTSGTFPQSQTCSWKISAARSSPPPNRRA